MQCKAKRNRKKGKESFHDSLACNAPDDDSISANAVSDLAILTRYFSIGNQDAMGWLMCSENERFSVRLPPLPKTREASLWHRRDVPCLVEVMRGVVEEGKPETSGTSHIHDVQGARGLVQIVAVTPGIKTKH